MRPAFVFGLIGLLDATSAALSPRIQTWTVSRRAAITFSIMIPPFPASASKFPQHVEDLDRAVIRRDVDAVRDALRVLGLPADDVAVRQTMVRAVVDTAVSVRSAATSTKVSVSLGSPPTEKEHYVRYIWLRNEATGGLLAVRDLKQ